MTNVPHHQSTVEYLETLRQAFQRDTERCAAAAPIRLTPMPRRNEGGRYSARSTWYDAIAEERIAAMEAEAAYARDDAAVEADLF